MTHLINYTNLTDHTNLTVHVEEDWFSGNIETKMNTKIDILQTQIEQQFKLIQTLADEISALKTEIHSTKHETATQKDRTHELLEELKILKQRELNIMLREKRPIPFVSGNHFFPLFSTILKL